MLDEVHIKALNIMKLKLLTSLGLASLLTLSCAQEASVQPAASSVAESAAASPVNSTKQADDKSGTFVNGERPTQGTVRLVTENGKRYLEFDESFKTSEMGPDLHVILHRSADVINSTKPPAYPIKEQDYVILGRLQKFSGSQRYPIAENINLADYQSAAVWCRKFNATFGAAKLSS